MAVGDEATASGYPLVPNSGEEGKVKWGSREINRTRDFVAQVKALVLAVWPIARGGTGATTAAQARVNLGLGVAATEDVVPVAKGGTGAVSASAARTALGLGSVATDSTVPVSRGGTGGTTASAARTNLGLGSVALDNTVPVTRGGTGADDRASARTNLGFRSGTASPSGGADGDVYFRIV